MEDLPTSFDQCIILFSSDGGESGIGGDTGIVMPVTRSGVFYGYLDPKRPRVRSFWDPIYKSDLYDDSNICLSL